VLENSSTILRLRANYYDYGITVPHIKRRYDWLLIYGEDDEKGDLMIDVSGSSSVAEREIQARQLPQILQYAMNPSFGKSPTKVLDELLESMKFDPGVFDMEEDEKKAAQQGQPQDPRIVVEQIRTQKDLQITDKKLQVEQMKVQSDVDRDALFQQGVTERNRNDYEATIAELQLRERLAMLEYANKHQDTLDNIKAKLADSSLKLSVQKELAAMSNNARQVITAPTEPRGRAENGAAYQQ